MQSDQQGISGLGRGSTDHPLAPGRQPLGKWPCPDRWPHSEASGSQRQDHPQIPQKDCKTEKTKRKTIEEPVLSGAKQASRWRHDLGARTLKDTGPMRRGPSHWIGMELKGLNGIRSGPAQRRRCTSAVTALQPYRAYAAEVQQPRHRH